MSESKGGIEDRRPFPTGPQPLGWCIGAVTLSPGALMKASLFPICEYQCPQDSTLCSLTVQTVKSGAPLFHVMITARVPLPTRNIGLGFAYNRVWQEQFLHLPFLGNHSYRTACFQKVKLSSRWALSKCSLLKDFCDVIFHDVAL